MTDLRKLSFLPLAGLLGACGGAGQVTLTTYGEDFIEVGIPAASEAAPEGVVDGWSVRFDQFLVVLADIEIGDEAGEIRLAPEARVFDLVAPGPHHLLTRHDLPAGAFDHLAASIRPDPAPVAGNVDEAAVGRMRDGGWSVWAIGRAQRAGVEKTFAWGFDLNTRYRDCADADARPGLVIPHGGRVTGQLTIHGDHLFYDDLRGDDAVMRFDPIADADLDGDGDVTLEELAAVDLTTLPADQYGTGGDGRVHDLAAFVRDQTSTLMHFQGEGDCLPGPGER